MLLVLVTLQSTSPGRGVVRFECAGEAQGMVYQYDGATHIEIRGELHFENCPFPPHGAAGPDEDE